MSGLPDSRDAAALAAGLAAVAPPGVRVGCRTIQAGDEALLDPAEAAALPTRDARARRASGAARALARELLADMGHPATSVPRGPTGRPIFPDGLVGSLAHDAGLAVAAVARRPALRSIGIDIEPAEPLGADVALLVIGRADDVTGLDPALAARWLFVAKEAVYKAVHPIDELMLDYGDIAVSAPERLARTRTGYGVDLAWCLTPRIVVVATLRA